MWPWPVLVLCGLPIAVVGAWRIYTGGPPRELVLDVGSDNTVTVTARRRFTTEENGRFPLADDRLHPAIILLARDAERDECNLPKLPVRIVLAEGRLADDVWRLLVGIMRSYLWEVTLEAQEFTVAFTLPKDVSCCDMHVIPKEVVGALVLPEREGERWHLTTYDSAEVPLTREFGFSSSPFYVDVEPCGARQWDAATAGLKRSGQETFATVEDADFSTLDVVTISWGPSAKAVDLVRAIAEIRASAPAPKVILVAPERLISR